MPAVWITDILFSRKIRDNFDIWLKRIVAEHIYTKVMREIHKETAVNV